MTSVVVKLEVGANVHRVRLPAPTMVSIAGAVRDIVHATAPASVKLRLRQSVSLAGTAAAAAAPPALLSGSGLEVVMLPEVLRVWYRDTDGDVISVVTDADLVEAVAATPAGAVCRLHVDLPLPHAVALPLLLDSPTSSDAETPTPAALSPAPVPSRSHDIARVQLSVAPCSVVNVAPTPAPLSASSCEDAPELLDQCPSPQPPRAPSPSSSSSRSPLPSLAELPTPPPPLPKPKGPESLSPLPPVQRVDRHVPSHELFRVTPCPGGCYSAVLAYEQEGVVVIMQLLQTLDRGCQDSWVWSRWTSPTATGAHKLQGPMPLSLAVCSFVSLFQRKTGVEWVLRHAADSYSFLCKFQDSDPNDVYTPEPSPGSTSASASAGAGSCARGSGSGRGSGRCSAAVTSSSAPMPAPRPPTAAPAPAAAAPSRVVVPQSVYTEPAPHLTRKQKKAYRRAVASGSTAVAAHASASAGYLVPIAAAFPTLPSPVPAADQSARRMQALGLGSGAGPGARAGTGTGAAVRDTELDRALAESSRVFLRLDEGVDDAEAVALIRALESSYLDPTFIG